jgi:hypothetical protein
MDSGSRNNAPKNAQVRTLDAQVRTLDAQVRIME